MLVVTDSVRMRSRLTADADASMLHLEFASCEYECSAVVDDFRPEFVVVDGTFSTQACSDLCSHLANDPRIPGVRIIFAAPQGSHESVASGLNVIGQLEQPFTLMDLEHFIAGRGSPVGEETTADCA